MRLAISNIAWTAQEDEDVYALMRKYGYTGLEIAPTRFFEGSPYDDLDVVRAWREDFAKNESFAIPSMQSIWFGRTEKLFADKSQRQVLSAYTKKAIDFAEAVWCANLVFGSPKNRVLPEHSDKELWQQGIAFFKELGDYACARNTAVSMEANPPIYQTNYINTTQEAFALIKEVASEGFLLNLDIGTMIENKEAVETLEGNAGLIHHVHISEPFLKPIAVANSDRRQFHSELSAFLKENNYQGYVSVEMGKTDDGFDRLSMIDEILAYGKEIFG
ncbi:MAG: sugar phosphate isomerase/epimerase [Lachnospiraceae bacterium]|nr:sugar phosphate isomerase/epimerase [Lachnospiraceae bacterium]